MSIDSFRSSLTAAEREALKFDWPSIARPNQLLPAEPWTTLVVQAGRGFGKTRMLSETIRRWNREVPITIVIAPTIGDVHRVLIDGPAGILAVCPRSEQPKINLGTLVGTWPNGSKVLFFSAQEPQRLRGPQCFKLACDELANWEYGDECWDNAQLGLRLGSNPQAIVTTTPRPTKLFRRILALPGTTVVRGSTFDNRANLAQSFLNKIVARYAGTRRGRQELEGELLEDVQGALWSRDLIDETRCKPSDVPVDLTRVVVAVDPAASNHEDSDETGIIAAARAENGHIYVLEDASGRYDPEQWARRAIASYHANKADLIVAEKNQGGQMVEATVRNVDNTIPYQGVHASRGKITRAEPVAALYTQRRVHHVGTFPQLEDQLCDFSGGSAESPDRLDALVHALTLLSDGDNGELGLIEYLKAVADGSVTDPNSRAIPQSSIEKVQEDQKTCPNCASDLLQTLPHGEKRCGACGKQFGIASFRGLPDSFLRTAKRR